MPTAETAAAADSDVTKERRVSHMFDDSADFIMQL
jgi:hypothetical protein